MPPAAHGPLGHSSISSSAVDSADSSLLCDQLQSMCHSIGACLMTIVNAIGTIFKAIINAFVSLFDALISCLTCGKGGRRRRTRTSRV